VFHKLNSQTSEKLQQHHHHHSRLWSNSMEVEAKPNSTWNRNEWIESMSMQEDEEFLNLWL
jgi:hypothetical protein